MSKSPYLYAVRGIHHVVERMRRNGPHLADMTRSPVEFALAAQCVLDLLNWATDELRAAGCLAKPDSRQLDLPGGEE